MLLEELIKPLKPVSITGTTAGIEISDLVCDSRHMVKGAMFVAVRGVAVDSHKFIPQVVADGAAAVVCEQLPEEVAGNVCYIVVENSTNALALLASAWNGYPSEKLQLVVPLIILIL